jgi:hypothetical protein
MLLFKMCSKAIPLGLGVAYPAVNSTHILVLAVTATMGAFFIANLTVSLQPGLRKVAIHSSPHFLCRCTMNPNATSCSAIRG